MDESTAKLISGFAILFLSLFVYVGISICEASYHKSELNKLELITIRFDDGNRSKKKKIRILDLEIQSLMKKRIEEPLNFLWEQAHNKKLSCHKELLDTYHTFSPYLNSIYDGLSEWENEYENAAKKETLCDEAKNKNIDDNMKELFSQYNEEGAVDCDIHNATLSDISYLIKSMID